MTEKNLRKRKAGDIIYLRRTFWSVSVRRWRNFSKSVFYFVEKNMLKIVDLMRNK